MTADAASRFDAAVLIGRFQPFHDGHLSLLRQALARAPRVVVVIGSAHQARSPKNPFTWQERAQMVRRAVPEAERARIACVPARDHFDETRWLAEVRVRVADALSEPGDPARAVLLVGHLRDATRDYLHAFTEWTLLEAPDVPLRRASAMRTALFATPPTQPLDALAGELPPSTLDLMTAFRVAPHFDALAEESALLQAYEASWASAPYPPVLVTVDCVVKCQDRVLLIERAQAPGKGLLAVPGGFLEQRETTLQAALRELEEETHLALPASALRACLRAADVFDRPDRSQRARTITHGYFFDLGPQPLPPLRADDDALAAEWTPIAAVLAREGRFLDDHFQMLDHYLGLLPRL